MRMIRFLVIAALILTARTVTAATVIYAPQSLDRYFRIETHVERGAKGPVVWGYVYNNTNLHAERMVVQVDALDASGAVVGSTTTWVPGLVPPTYRAYFETRAPEGAQYRVQVLSFDWTGRGGGSGN
jgi:hypothetical protein